VWNIVRRLTMLKSAASGSVAFHEGAVSAVKQRKR
jgi:hypothetical protein